MKEEVVFPGSFLSSGEEYLPGQNTLEHQDGNIYSSAFGKPIFNNEKKVVIVQSTAKEVKLVDVGSIVFAKVEGVKESLIFVEILQAENNGEKRSVGSAQAFLPVFNVRNGYVDVLSELFKIGDVIKARVAGVTPYSIELETRSNPSFGIVKGFCAKCRAVIGKLHNGFKCTKCALEANRKFSLDYLLG